MHIYQAVASGNLIDFTDFDPASIDIKDIARALSRIPRYCGHTVKPYYVAQHCILMAIILAEDGYSTEVQLAGLLHEVGEAYLTGDIHGLAKRSMGKKAKQWLHNHDAKIEAAINPYIASCRDIIDLYDSRLLRTEMQQLFEKPIEVVAYKDGAEGGKPSGDKYAPLPMEIVPWNSRYCEKMFLMWYEHCIKII